MYKKARAIKSVGKSCKNVEYLAMIDRSIAQFEAGKAQEHELIEVE